MLEENSDKLKAVLTGGQDMSNAFMEAILDKGDAFDVDEEEWSVSSDEILRRMRKPAEPRGSARKVL